jgi:hypothetical protein
MMAVPSQCNQYVRLSSLTLSGEVTGWKARRTTLVTLWRALSFFFRSVAGGGDFRRA